MTTKKLYVGNLPFTADETTLRTHFEGDGRKVDSVKIMMDRETGRSRGFAFVDMSSPEDAQKAIAALNNKDFLGRPLMINEAREQPPRVGGGFGGPRPNGFGGPSSGGPRPVGGGFSSGGPRPGGFGGGGGAFPPSGLQAEPLPEEKGGRAKRDQGKDRDRDRRKRGKGDDW